MSVMEYKQKRAITLIELIMTMTIITVLSVSGAYILTYLVQSAVFIPNKLNVDMLASDAIDIMIEGDTQAKGLRFSQSITDIQPYEVTFNNQDGEIIRYWFDAGTDRLCRSIDGVRGFGDGPNGEIPYYVPAAGVSLAGESGQIFTYYDAGEAVTGNPVDVRRIAIAIVAMTGSGAFDDWQGQVTLNSAIAVKRFKE